jgi:hypothetical protein
LREINAEWVVGRIGVRRAVVEPQAMLYLALDAAALLAIAFGVFRLVRLGR